MNVKSSGKIKSKHPQRELDISDLNEVEKEYFALCLRHQNKIISRVSRGDLYAFWVKHANYSMIRALTIERMASEYRTWVRSTNGSALVSKTSR